MKQKSKQLWLLAFLLPTVILSFKPKPNDIKKLLPTDITSVSTELVEVHCHVSAYRFTANGSNAATYDWEWSYSSTSGFSTFHTNWTTTTLWVGDQSCDVVYIKVTPKDSGGNPGNTFGPIQSDNCTPYDDPNCKPSKLFKISKTKIHPTN